MLSRLSEEYAVRILLALFLSCVLISCFAQDAARPKPVETWTREFYEFLQANAYEKARDAAEWLQKRGVSTNNLPLEARGLIRLAYLELHAGKWKNDWEEKLKRSRTFSNETGTIERAEFLMFFGHMQGKWLAKVEQGTQKSNEALLIAG